MTAPGLSSDERLFIYQAAMRGGINPDNLSPDNPFSKSGDIARNLQMLCQEFDPVKAASLRQKAGGQMSLSAAVALDGNCDLTPAARESLMLNSPEFAADVIAQQQKSEAEAIAELDAAAEAMRRNRMGDAAYAKQVAEEQQQAELAQQRAVETREMEQRIKSGVAATTRFGG